MLMVFLVGPPGVGKSTLMTELTASCSRLPADKPVPHEALMHAGLLVGAEIGRRRAAFSGTDALPMDVQPAASTWITTRPYDLILGEGARLSTIGFLHTAHAAGYRMVLFALHAPDEVLQARRTERGSNQDPKWMRGATTRARKVCERMSLDAAVHPLNAAAPPAELAAQVWRLEPELEVLRA